jgi:hypothetical protein
MAMAITARWLNRVEAAEMTRPTLRDSYMPIPRINEERAGRRVPDYGDQGAEAEKDSYIRVTMAVSLDPRVWRKGLDLRSQGPQSDCAGVPQAP